MSEKTTRVKCDPVTDKWSKAHPDCVFTATQCKDCGLFYKPSLGHQCVGIGKEREHEKDTDAVYA